MLIAFTNENVYWWFVTTNITCLSILCIYNIINASQLWLWWYIMYIIIARCAFQVSEWLTTLKVVGTTQEQGTTYSKINPFSLNEAHIGSEKGKRKIKFKHLPNTSPTQESPKEVKCTLATWELTTSKFVACTTCIQIVQRLAKLFKRNTHNTWKCLWEAS